MQAKYNEPCLPQYHEAMVEESSGTEQRIFAKIQGTLMPLLIGYIGEFILRSRMRQKKSMPNQNWRLAMSRFIIVFGDRLNDHL